MISHLRFAPPYVYAEEANSAAAGEEKEEGVVMKKLQPGYVEAAEEEKEEGVVIKKLQPGFVESSVTTVAYLH